VIGFAPSANRQWGSSLRIVTGSTSTVSIIKVRPSLSLVPGYCELFRVAELAHATTFSDSRLQFVVALHHHPVAGARCRAPMRRR
jgi:hypothetical protein